MIHDTFTFGRKNRIICLSSAICLIYHSVCKRFVKQSQKCEKIMCFFRVRISLIIKCPMCLFMQIMIFEIIRLKLLHAKWYWPVDSKIRRVNMIQFIIVRPLHSILKVIINVVSYTNYQSLKTNQNQVTKEFLYKIPCTHILSS